MRYSLTVSSDKRIALQTERNVDVGISFTCTYTKGSWPNGFVTVGASAFMLCMGSSVLGCRNGVANRGAIWPYKYPSAVCSDPQGGGKLKGVLVSQTTSVDSFGIDRFSQSRGLR